MSRQLKKIQNSIKWVSWSASVAVAIGLLVGIPSKVTAQTQSPPSVEQKPALEEANRLIQQIGQLQKQYQYSTAIPLAESLLGIMEKLLGKEHPDIVTNLNLLALLYYINGSYQKAEPLYLRALAIREKALGKEHSDVATILDKLAHVYLEQGNYQKAESLLLRALVIREKALGKEHIDVATILNKLAQVYFQQGSYQKSETLLQRVLLIHEKVLGKEHPDIAPLLNNLALLYQKKRSYQKAEPLFLRALAISEKALSKEHPVIAIDLNNLANLYREQGSYEKAEPLLLRALEITKRTQGKEHPNIALFLNNLANLYRGQGDNQKAEPLFLRALAINEKALGKEHPRVATTLTNLALLYSAQDDIIRATDFLHRGLEVEEHNFTLIYAVGSEQRKQDYAKTFMWSTDAAISLLLQQTSKNPEVARLALTTVLRRKGRVLDAIADNVQTLRSQLASQPETKQLFEQWSNILQQLSALVYTGLEKQTPQTYQTRFQQLEAEKERLEEVISTKSAVFRNVIQPVELKDIQAKTPVDAALVEFVLYLPFNPKAKANQRWGKPRYAAAVLRSQGEPKWVDLGDADAINKSITRLRKSLSTRSYDNDDLKQVNQFAYNLEQQVIAPIRPLLGNSKHLLLSPDGLLTLIPFEVLRDKSGQYLIQQYAFSYLTSGRDLLRLQSSAKNGSDPVVFADINYDQQDSVAAVPNSSNTRGSSNSRSIDLTKLSFEPLAATLEEAQAIQAIFPNTKILQDKQATETALKQLSGNSILHLATHGFFLPNQQVQLSIQKLNTQQPKPWQLENPLLRSGIALAGFNARGQTKSDIDDGVLTALEVAGLNLQNTQLVVLSACETGLGDVNVGEGVYGLRRALVIAGSQSQVLSLWRVDDTGTKDLMVKYYQKLKAGQGKHEALRQAQLELLNDPNYQHPYFWASFVPSGDWTPLKF